MTKNSEIPLITYKYEGTVNQKPFTLTIYGSKDKLKNDDPATFFEDNPDFSPIPGFSESDCQHCPNWDPANFTPEIFTWELLAAALSDVIVYLYRQGQAVPEEVKIAYNDCCDQLGHCEPLETRRPLY